MAEEWVTINPFLSIQNPLSKYADKTPLKELTLSFLHFMNLKIQKSPLETIITAITGIEHQIDFIVSNTETITETCSLSEPDRRFQSPYYRQYSAYIGIIIKDYQKPVDISVIRHAYLLERDFSLRKIILVANQFGIPATLLAQRCRIILITRSELESFVFQRRMDTTKL